MLALSGGHPLAARLSTCRFSSSSVFALLLVHLDISFKGKFTRMWECSSLKNTSKL
jgi:hypothetical protein